MAKKVYAIKKGVHPTTGKEVKNIILDKSWAEVEQYIKGVQGALFKSFKSKKEAEAYLKDKSSDKEEKDELSSLSHKKDVLYCYVDGSYNKDIPNYGYGLVSVVNGWVKHTDKGAGTNSSAIEMFQVGGELLGAMKALMYAKNNNHRHVVIYHDYLGVGKHATGEWKRKTAFSKVYYEWMQNFFQSNPKIKIEFKKVKAHVGDDFNELADGLAKLSVAIKPAPVFYEMVDKHRLSFY